jgi:hypothetical protein
MWRKDLGSDVCGTQLRMPRLRLQQPRHDFRARHSPCSLRRTRDPVLFLHQQKSSAKSRPRKVPIGSSLLDQHVNSGGELSCFIVDEMFWRKRTSCFNSTTLIYFVHRLSRSDFSHVSTRSTWLSRSPCNCKSCVNGALLFFETKKSEDAEH